MLFTAFISVNLGIMNLLPLPVLDGGYIALFLGEFFLGKELAKEKLKKIQYGGMAFFIVVTLFTTFKDVIKWLNIKKHAGFMISPNLWSEDQDNPTWIVQSEKPAMYYEGTTDYEETVNNGFQKYVKLLGVE